jgi:hypothetical protein
MSYFYGDSSPSPLKTNFLELLRYGLEFSVHVLLSTERRKREDERIEELEREAERTKVRFEALGESANQAIEKYSSSTDDSRVHECARRIGRSVAQNLARSNEELAEMLATERGHRDEHARQERVGCLEALGTMLAHSDLPNATFSTHIDALEQGGYSAWIEGCDPMGLEWQIELAVPETSAFAQHVRVEKYAPILEISAPAMGGWLKKEVKVRPVRLERLLVLGVAISPDATTLRLREFPTLASAGYDLVVREEGHHVEMRWVGEGASPEDAPFEPSEDDANKILELRDAVRKAAVLIARKRTRLVRASFRGSPFEELRDQTPIVHALVELAVPITREVARHSLQPNELVLRRLLSDDRREEFFVTKASLAEKLNPLPTHLQPLFEGFALDRPTTMAPAAGMTELGDDAIEVIEQAHTPTVRPEATAVPAPALKTQPVVPKINTAILGNGSGVHADGELPPSAPYIDTAGRAPSPLVIALKRIVGLAKQGKVDDSYGAYAELFTSTLFAECRLEDQRQALRLMVMPKVTPPITPAVVEAHRAAMGALQALVNASGEPADYEMLGICQAVLDLKEAASSTFKAALAIERERHPGSKLATELEKRAATT